MKARWPRRRWVVEYRPSPFPEMPWTRSLGPYFRKGTAEAMMRRCKWFDRGLISWRVRDVA